MRTKNTKGFPELCGTFYPKDYVICFEPTHSLLSQQILTEHALDIYRCL